MQPLATGRQRRDLEGAARDRADQHEQDAGGAREHGQLQGERAGEQGGAGGGERGGPEHEQHQVEGEDLGRTQQQSDHQPHGRGHRAIVPLIRAWRGAGRGPECEPGRATMGGMTAYVAQLRVYEPLAAFPADERASWERYAASGDAPSRERAAAIEHEAGLRALVGLPPARAARAAASTRSSPRSTA